MTLAIGLLGAGRIGLTHAKALMTIDGAELAAVHDPVAAAAARVAAMTGARVANLDALMADGSIRAVIVATPTDLHAAQVEAAAKAGKAIFCEKPIDLDVGRVRTCLEVVEATGAKLMVGFNRRFDPHFAELQRRVRAGEIGRVELVQITSRDPAPPPLGYVRRSGGLFRDMMIHDFDMARFLLGEEVAEVSATGAVLVDPAIGEAGDVDTATATLRTASGRLAVITNSRRATYGYDQRAEVHGSLGMLAVANPPTSTVRLADATGYRAAALHNFFMTRYAEAYRLELQAFVAYATGAAADVPTGRDGLRALELADAAVAAARSGRTVSIAAAD